jgi:uncharacterized protein (TIGR03032 family)
LSSAAAQVDSSISDGGNYKPIEPRRTTCKLLRWQLGYPFTSEQQHLEQENPSAAKNQPEARGPYREVKFRHSRDFLKLIEGLGASLLISTYQAGKLVAVGTHENALSIALHNFEQAMGIAVHPARLAVGSRGAVWFLQNAAEFAPRLKPAGRYDACFLARQSFITGNIHAHEMAWVGDELWVVNTLFSCLCTLHEDYSFVPRWQPPFITELAGNDRCHLNGLALDAGQPKFVTVMAESNEPAGWRSTKATSGRILDIASGQAVTGGLAMPHSPRVHGGRLWVLNSGCGTLEVVDPHTGQRDVVAHVPGYTRGLAFCKNFAFVGMSRIRETAIFGGVPIAERRNELKCAVAVVDLRSGQSVAYLEFETGVEEIFDVQVLQGARCVSLTGPFPAQDDAQDIWVVPPPGQVPQSVAGRAATAVPTIPASGPPQPLSDEDVTALVRSGLALQQQGRFADAVEALRQAVAARPQSAELHNHLGNALQDFGRQDLALESYERASAANQGFAPAQQNLGYLLVNVGRLDEGLVHIERAQQLQPSAMNRVMLATSLPVVYESTEDLRRRRQRLEASVQSLVDEGVSIDTTHAIVPTNFFAAYQGHDDCDLQRKLSRIFHAPQLVKKRTGKRRAGRIRVGFLSSHFHDHTIGRLNLGRVKLLDRERFEVVLISLSHHQDAMAEEFRRAADQLVESVGSLDVIRRAVAELKLDVLVFTDIGMNTTTYTLAMSRLAPVQCVTWGHPVTTGNASMDFFISGQWLETPESDAHYTERLVRLANLGTYYYRPQLAGQKTRESFGIDPNRHVYLCPQTLFKMHPEFDAILGEILRRDPAGELVLIQGRQPQWTRMLGERFQRTIGDVVSRIRFLPSQPNADFLQLNAVADVLLDTIYFGGGNTSYEGLALGTPIVTLPGQLLRGRITLALYQKMGLMDCVVETPDEYVDLTVRLGTDREYRQSISRKIQDKCGVLFEDPAEVRELERFLVWAADGGKAEWLVVA